MKLPFISAAPPKPLKIVGLVPAKNEAKRIASCLRVLCLFCDAIVYLDDNSQDESAAIVRSLAAECRIERIVEKKDDEFHETIRRATLLQAGRELGGTHFIVMDADEMPTAACRRGGFLRRRVSSLRPGDTLQMVWLQLWRSPMQYRCDRSIWTNQYRGCAFADDRRCAYPETFIHLDRIPAGLSGRGYRIRGDKYGVMHFQFANWPNLLVKQAWYRCLERVNYPRKPAAAINALYAPSKDERGLRLRPAPSAWFDGYPFLDPQSLARPEPWRERQVLEWFDRYGADYFRDLDIWDIDWETSRRSK